MTPLLQMIIGASTLAAGTAGVCGYYATYGVRTQWLGPTVWRGRTDTRSVVLTFDDGPAEATDRILDILGGYGIRAAFFMVGREVQRRPDTARRIVAAGHDVGNHSYSHPIYLYRSASDTYEQLARTQNIIADVTGVEPVWSRPPCGVRTPAYFRAANALGLRTVQWTVAGFDWQRRSAIDIAGAVLRRAASGSIILLHDGATTARRDRRQTILALPAIIEGLKARGLRCSSLPGLLRRDDTTGGPLTHV